MRVLSPWWLLLSAALYSMVYSKSLPLLSSAVASSLRLVPSLIRWCCCCHCSGDLALVAGTLSGRCRTGLTPGLWFYRVYARWPFGLSLAASDGLGDAAASDEGEGGVSS
jgi:hypothetical protein